MRESHPIAAALQQSWHELFALLWPTACVGCGAADRDICANCEADLLAMRGRVQHATSVAGPISVVGPYDGLLRSVLIAYKHEGLTQLAGQLATCLSTALSEAVRRAQADATMPPIIVTVPSRAARVRERGYRHIDLLVQRALRRSRVESTGSETFFVPGALRALPGRTSQVGLDSRERARNAALVAVPRRMRGRIRGRNAVLVDDVVTTGATVAAAARVLEAAGARVVAVVALCATERKDFRESVEVKPP